MSGKDSPLHSGFLVRILYETNAFLKKCPLEGGVRYRGCPLYRGFTVFVNLEIGKSMFWPQFIDDNAKDGGPGEV